MKATLFIFIALVSNIIIAQTNPGLTFGGLQNDDGSSLCLSSDGGFVIVGNTRSYGSGSNDIYLIKLNKFYKIDWTLIYGWEHQDFARSIITTEGGYLIIGDVWDLGHPTSYDVYLLKVNNEGDKIMEQTYGTSGFDFGFKVHECLSGNLLFVGYSRGFDPKGDIFLVMTDAEGNEIWNNNYGYDFDDYAMDVLENDDGSFMVIGSRDGFFDDVHANYKTHDADILLLKIDAEGNEIWKKNYGEDGHDFGYGIEHADDGYYLFGSTQSYGEGNFDMILTKVDYEGEKEWHVTYGGIHYDYGISIDKNNEGDLYLLGTTKSFGQDESADIYLIKTDELGNEKWNLTIGGVGADFAKQVVSTSDSGCAIIGSTQSFGSGEKDMLFVKINKNGEIEELLNSGGLNYNSLVIAPNPVHDSGRIILDNNNNIEYTLELSTMSGAIVKKYNLNSNNPSFNTMALPTGTYVYKLTNNNDEQIQSGKLIIY